MKLKAADAIWVAVAHLHQEHPDSLDFPIAVVVKRTLDEGLTDAAPITIQTHAYRHLVANLEPKHATYRMLQETSPGHRRLHLLTDTFHPGRRGAPDRLGTRITPAGDDLPVDLRPLLAWYEHLNNSHGSEPTAQIDQLLALRGKGRELWSDEHSDAYVRRLRAAWV